MPGRIWSRGADILDFILKKRQTRRGIAAFLFFAIITVLISIEFVPHRINLKVGQVSPSDIFSPRSIVFEDQAKTEELRMQAALTVKNQYERDNQVSITVQKDVSLILANIKKIQNERSIGEEERLNKLRQAMPFTVSHEMLVLLSKTSPESLQLTEREVNGLIAQALDSEQGITQDNLADNINTIISKIKKLRLKQPYEDVAIGLVKSCLRPNTFLNAEKTSQLKEAARETVIPQQITISQGEKIVGAGEIVKNEQMAKLKALGLTQNALPWKIIIGNGLLVVLLMVVVLFYLYQQNKEIYMNSGHLYLLGIIILLTMIVAKAIVAINSNQWPELSGLFGYMAPIAAGGMLIAILLDSRLAVLVVAIMCFFLMLMTDGQLRFGVVGLVGGITGIYRVSRLSKSGDLTKAGLYTALASFFSIGIMELTHNTPIGLVITLAIIFGVTNGLISSILTIGMLPYLESTFKITSSVRFMELSHPGNPLLKRLLTEAPGTYHHSIIVGNLAEAAAEAIGGDTLITRVGAYYHDVGKLKRPYFFIENQLDADNPHDRIAPSLSTLILTSHVKDGVDLAREYKLPEDIINIVEQHHGSGLCTFFYHKAMESSQNENINEDEFRYEGPKPKTKEAALVMLADSVEAAVRSLQNRTRGRVEGMMRKIIKDKLMDGQLDECDLTFKDLDIIATAFMQVFSGIFHARIEYPDLSKEIERRKTKGAGIRKQSFRRDSRGK